MRADLLVPALEQALALGGRAVLREVVVDELDVGDLRRQRRDRRADVRRNLELLRLRAQRLRLRRQRPVVELLRVVQVARALDDRQRADFVAGAFARRDALHRKAGLRLGDDVVDERDARERLAARGRLDRRRRPSADSC